MISARHGSRRKAIAAAVLAALAGCGGCESVPSGAVTQCDQTTVIPSKTDILFVIDDSGSMSEEQANLAQNLDAFVDRLAAAPVKPDYQIGVTTTSVEGFAGQTAYAAGPSAGVPYPAGALVALDPATHKLQFDAATSAFTGARILRAGSPTLAQDFKANVVVGIDGSGKEMALEAVRRALSVRVTDGANAGFLRSGASLAIVILSDEDDCTEPAGQHLATGNNQCRDAAFKTASLEPVQDFIAFLKEPIAGEVRDISVAAIIAVDPTTRARGTSCATAPDAAVRYWDFAHDPFFAERTLTDSICNASFHDTLDSIARLVSQRVALSQAPSDPSLLQVAVTHADGSRTACTLVPAGADTSAADAVFAPPRSGSSATLTFQRGCLLEQGDRIELKILCAG